MYKDKDKQREANRQAKSRQRSRDNEPQGMTNEDNVIPKTDIRVIPERTAQGNVRVSKPGDADYEPQCETTRAFVEGRDKRPEAGKRGKDIKCFADLPPDVQQHINETSQKDDEIDKGLHTRLTGAAINYQHQFPDRYHSTGVAI